MARDPHLTVPAARRAGRLGWWLLALLGLTPVAVTGWLNDAVTLEDHWSLYTARWVGGQWQEHRCTGTLLAAERFDYTASTVSQSVQVRVDGAPLRQAVLRGCQVVDGRNWSCPLAPEPATFAFAIQKGLPTILATGRFADEQTTKADWLWLRLTGAAMPAQAASPPAPAPMATGGPDRR